MWRTRLVSLVVILTIASIAAAETDVGAQQRELRAQLTQMLGIPEARCDLAPEARGQFERDGIVVEKWILTLEPGSRTPAILYRPSAPKGKMPAIVFTYGHGGSKSSWQYNYAGMLYAKLGLACLAIDPIGEEERNLSGRMGSRAHDRPAAYEPADAAGRLIMGKVVFDAMRAVDYLMSRDDIDHDRIGVAGNSMGGATAGWMAALETRLKLALVCGWAFDDIGLTTKHCQSTPIQRMRARCDWGEYLSLAAPHCAVAVLNGDADTVIDRNGDHSAWAGTRRAVAAAAKVYELYGQPPGRIDTWFQPGGGHRPYFAHRVALEWIHRHLGTPNFTLAELRARPTVNAGQWCDEHGVDIAREKLYANDLHWRGATLVDVNLRPMTREDLACLRPDELGDDQYTLEGWLKLIQRP